MTSTQVGQITYASSQGGFIQYKYTKATVKTVAFLHTRLSVVIRLL